MMIGGKFMGQKILGLRDLKLCTVRIVQHACTCMHHYFPCSEVRFFLTNWSDWEFVG